MANLHNWVHLTLPYFLKSNHDTPARGNCPHSFGLVAFSVFPGSIPLCFCCVLAQEKLHREEFGDGRGAVEVAGEAMLEAIARRRELLTETVHLVLCEWREIPGDSGVLLEHG